MARGPRPIAGRAWFSGTLLKRKRGGGESTKRKKKKHQKNRANRQMFDSFAVRLSEKKGASKKGGGKGGIKKFVPTGAWRGGTVSRGPAWSKTRRDRKKKFLRICSKGKGLPSHPGRGPGRGRWGKNFKLRKVGGDEKPPPALPPRRPARSKRAPKNGIPSSLLEHPPRRPRGINLLGDIIGLFSGGKKKKKKAQRRAPYPGRGWGGPTGNPKNHAGPQGVATWDVVNKINPPRLLVVLRGLKLSSNFRVPLFVLFQSGAGCARAKLEDLVDPTKKEIRCLQ